MGKECIYRKGLLFYHFKLKYFYFTLIELTVSLAAFAVILVVVLKFYESAENAAKQNLAKAQAVENAIISLDLITRDIQSIFYEKKSTVFWHWRPTVKPASWGKYRNELLAFTALSNVLPNKSCKSMIYEIKYQLYYATNKEDFSAGWLRRSITGDFTSSGENKKWNIGESSDVGYTTDEYDPSSVFTANSNSSEYYQKVIPYVVDIQFVCYDEEGNIIPPDTTTSKISDACETTEMPFSIEVDLSLLDKNSWNKWLTMFPAGDYPKNEPLSAELFRKEHEITFEKNIYIGNRGQYNQLLVAGCQLLVVSC